MKIGIWVTVLIGLVAWYELWESPIALWVLIVYIFGSGVYVILRLLAPAMAKALDETNGGRLK